MNGIWRNSKNAVTKRYQKKISEKDRNLDLDIQELKAQLSNSDKENMLLKRGIKKFKGQSEAIIAKKEQTIKDLEDEITNL